MNSIEPISGWMLDQIVRLDEVRPGFAGHILRASAERRHVIAAFLSVVERDDEVEDEVAYFLSTSGHSAILQFAYEHVPDGFRTALARCGPHVHEPDFYFRLWAFLCRAPGYAISVIRQLTELNPDRLDIITRIPVDLCDVRIVEKLKDAGQAADVVLALDFMELRGIDRSQIIGALRQSGKITETIRRWGYRIPFPRGPIAAVDKYSPVTNGIELAAMSKRYRNCSRRYFDALTAGEHAFGEFVCGDNAVILSFDRAQGFWLLAGVYSHNNGPVPADVSTAAYRFAANHGVLDRMVRDRGDKSLEALRRLSGRHFEWDV